MGNVLIRSRGKLVWLALLAATTWGLSANPAVCGDHVIANDLIVKGSECVGFDCADGESFGFDTIRLKENNLRIKFQDTSNSASFPTNDWQLTANDSTNGGADKFSIDDIDGGRTPFTIEAGAKSHSLYVHDTGRVGLGTSNPYEEIHVACGDTPAVRLEQNGTSGWTPQIWDVAGNETNFFIRDVTTGSKLPFRIQPGAPTNSLTLRGDGNVGVGTWSPDNTLHVFKASAGGVTGGVNSPLVVENDTFCFINLLSPDAHGVGVAFGDQDRVDSGLIQYSHPDDSMRFNTNAAERLRITSSGNVGIGGSASLNHQLEIQSGASYSEIDAGETQFTASSSREHKENIRPVHVDGLLDKIAEVPVVAYDWKPDCWNGSDETRKDKLGLIAEEFHTVLKRGSDKTINGQEVQMTLWAAVQQLHAENKELSQRLIELEQMLKASSGGE